MYYIIFSLSEYRDAKSQKKMYGYSGENDVIINRNFT